MNDFMIAVDVKLPDPMSLSDLRSVPMIALHVKLPDLMSLSDMRNRHHVD